MRLYRRSGQLKKTLDIEIFSGDFIGKGHTISQLAKFGAKVFKTDKVKVVIFSKNPNENVAQKAEVYIDSDSEYSSHNQHTRIFHLGNNSQSLPVFKALISSKTKKNIVILHDIYLGDLFAKFLETENQTNRENKYMSILGTSDYLLFILQNKNHNESNKEFKARISVKFLNFFIPKGTVLVHGENEIYETHLANYNEPHNLHLIDLPIGYHEIQRNKKLKNSYDLIISGHSSPSKKIEYVTHQIEKLCEERELKVLFLGSISEQVKNSTLANTKMVQLIEHCSDEEWDGYHNQSKIGIRIGVGEQGEKSGTVRDYIVYGVQVLTDERTNYFRKYPNYILYDETTPLASQIKKILDNATDQKYKPTPSNVKEYYEKILSIAGYETDLDSQINPTFELTEEKQKIFPVLNIKFARILVGKFDTIYFIRTNSEIWQIELCDIFKEFPEFHDFSDEESLDTIDPSISKHVTLISEVHFLFMKQDPDEKAIIIESITDLVWIKGAKQCHQILGGDRISKNTLFIYKEERDVSALENIPDFNLILELLMHLTPWQSFEFKKKKFEPNQKVFCISEAYQINYDEELEVKFPIKNSLYKDHKTLANVSHLTETLFIKHVPITDSRNTSRLFSEFMNWTEMANKKSFFGNFDPKPRLSFNPWGAHLTRRKIEGSMLTEMDLDQNKTHYLKLVFEEAVRFGKQNLFPNDLRPWNVLVDGTEAKFIDIINDIRKDEDADGIPQILALHLTLEYIRRDNLEIPGKIKEIREALKNYGDIPKEKLDSIFAHCWSGLEKYEPLLLNESSASDLLNFILRTSKNV